MKRKKKHRKPKVLFSWGGQTLYGEITGGNKRNGYEVRQMGHRVIYLVSSQKIVILN